MSMSTPRKRLAEDAEDAPESSKRRRVDDHNGPNGTDPTTVYPTPSTPSNRQDRPFDGGNESPLKGKKVKKRKQVDIYLERDLVLPEEVDFDKQNNRSTGDSTVP
ncbi:hypothetical protein FRC17_010624, partial [Serendipita sp. 399]